MAQRDSIVTDVEQTVIDIDLRERYDDLLSLSSFVEVQRVFADALGVGESDSTRVLIIDDARDLEKHTQGLERIVKSPGVEKVICLAVGPPRDQPGSGLSRLAGTYQPGQRPVALRKPFALGAPRAVTLWIGDARGVGFEMNQHKAQSIAAGPDPTRGPVLDALVDALRIPKIFDRVLEVVGAFPDGTAAPGLRAMLGRLDDDVLADARVRAIDRVLAPRPLGGEDRPDRELVTEPFRLMLRYPRVAGADESVLTPTGAMNSVVSRSRSRISEAQAALAVITSPGAVLQRLRGRGSHLSHAGILVASVRDVGGQLTSLGAELARLFEAFDSRRPLGTTATVDLERRGFALTPPNGTDRTTTLASLRHLVENALARKNPVTEITGWLTWMHEKLVPTGSAARLDALNSICDEDKLRQLRDMPRRLDVSLYSPWAVLPVLVCCLLAGMATGSTSVGALVGALAVVFIATRGWRLVTARRIRPGHSQSLSDLVFLILLGLLTVAGVAGMIAISVPSPTELVLAQIAAWSVGMIGLVCWWLLLGQEAHEGERNPLDLVFLTLAGVGAATIGLLLVDSDVIDPVLILPVQILAGIVAVVGLTWWPLTVWSRAVRKWGPGYYVRLADATAEQLFDLMVDVARYDWMLTGPRRDGADLVRAMSIAFGDITNILEKYADRLRGHPSPQRRHSDAGLDTEVAQQLRKKGPEITKLVESDIIDLVSSVVEECWPDVEREALDALAERVTMETEAGLDVYGRHLDRMGIHAAPPFGEPDENRRELVDTVWQESQRLGKLLRASVTDRGLLQLCAPEHLQMLEVDPATATTVRFAPKAAQPALVQRNAASAGGAQPLGPLPPSILGDLVWPEWGQVAGVLRLVRMRPGTVETILEENS